MSGVVVLATGVLEGTGAGNAGAPFCAAVAELTCSGVVVALSVRVAEELVRRTDHVGTPVPTSPLGRKH